MIDWKSQPYDVANIYNPAFTSELLLNCVSGYTSESGEGMPLELAFIALPLLLYKDSRHSLAKKPYRYFRTWLDETPEVRVSLAERARELQGFVKLGVAFALQHDGLRLDPAGGLRLQTRKRRSKRVVQLADGSAFDTFKAEHFKAAERLGRLLYQGGQLHNVFIALGVRP